jgi:hypothetical protein
MSGGLPALPLSTAGAAELPLLSLSSTTSTVAARRFPLLSFFPHLVLLPFLFHTGTTLPLVSPTSP